MNDELTNGYFIENDTVRIFTIHRGIRYVHTLPIVDEENETTTGCCQAKFEDKSFMDSYGWQYGIGKTPGF